MKLPDKETIEDLIKLSALLGEFDAIKRVTLLPGGAFESDSHHSFSLALMAYEFAAEFAPDLDKEKILLYALVHDLSELITGDMNTLTATTEQLEAKRERDTIAAIEIVKQFEFAPRIARAIEAYESKVDAEAIFIYWFDKVVVVPSHFVDNGVHLRNLGVTTKEQATEWYDRVVAKLQKEDQLGHEAVVALLELAHQKLREMFF